MQWVLWKRGAQGEHQAAAEAEEAQALLARMSASEGR
jgi:hypothetical protein